MEVGAVIHRRRRCQQRVVLLMGIHLGLAPRRQQSDEDQGAQRGAHGEADGGCIPYAEASGWWRVKWPRPCP